MPEIGQHRLEDLPALARRRTTMEPRRQGGGVSSTTTLAPYERVFHTVETTRKQNNREQRRLDARLNTSRGWGLEVSHNAEMKKLASEQRRMFDELQRINAGRQLDDRKSSPTAAASTLRRTDDIQQSSRGGGGGGGDGGGGGGGSGGGGVAKTAEDRSSDRTQQHRPRAIQCRQSSPPAAAAALPHIEKTRRKNNVDKTETASGAKVNRSTDAVPQAETDREQRRFKNRMTAARKFAVLPPIEDSLEETN